VEQQSMKWRTALSVALGFGALLGAARAYSQTTYPVKPVRVIVPFPPGGTNDIVARFVMRDLSEVMGQQYVVENRAGASGVIGAEAVAKSPPDGYTLMVHSSSHLSNAFAYKKLPYDTFKDFEPIGFMAAQPGVLVVHPSLPVKSVRDFIALAKARPGQITYASNGEGGSLHVQMALFASMANIQLIHVPYKGGAPVATSLASGETQSSISTIGIVLPHIRNNRLRALATSSAKRSTILPNLPTIAEVGVPGYDMNPWVGGFAPAGTPKAITERLHAEINKALGKRELAKQMADQAVEPWIGTQQEFAARLKTDYEKFQKIFKIIGTPAAS
jgi:tripartite-type tricarboxylate transporter receptor subunit TctC